MRGRNGMACGCAALVMVLLSSCSQADEEVTAEALVQDDAVEAEVKEKAQSLEQAADEAVLIMENEILQASAATKPDSQ